MNYKKHDIDIKLGDIAMILFCPKETVRNI